MNLFSLVVPTPEVVWWALIPVILFSASGLLLLTVASLVRRLPTWFPSALTIIVSIIVLLTVIPMWNYVQDKGPVIFLSGAVAVDISALFVIFILGIAVLATAMLVPAYLKRERLSGVELYVLLLLSAAGGVVMASTNDLIVLFLGLEILSIAVYVLVAMHLRRVQSQEAAIKYFILGAFASAFFLYGMALIYGATGSTNLTKISDYLTTNVLVEDAMLLAGFALLLVGFGFKIAAIPFHAWTPDVYQGAPTPVVAWMASGVKAAAFAALIRTFVLSLNTYSDDWQPVLAVLAGVTILGGAVLAVVQTDVKRMLAYSSIAHTGFILIGVQTASDQGTSAVLIYLGVYTFLAVGSFAVLTVVGGSGDTNHDLDSYRSLSRRQPSLSIAFTVLLLGQAGIPFTGGFVAKLGVIAASVEIGSYLLAGLAMLGAAITAFMYLRLLIVMYLKESGDVDKERIEIPIGARLVVILTAICVLVIGFVPGPLIDLANNAVPILIGG